MHIPQLLSPFMTLNKKKFCIQKASHTQRFDLLSQKPCPEQLFWQTENSKYRRLTWKIKHCNEVSVQLTIYIFNILNVNQQCTCISIIQVRFFFSVALKCNIQLNRDISNTDISNSNTMDMSK